MPEYISEKLELRISSIQLREDGIMHIDIRGDELFVLKDVHELIEAAGKIGGGARFPNLITIGEYTIPDAEARKFASSPEGSIYKTADAFVIKSFSQVLVANFYVKVNKPFVPSHFFKKTEEAEKWLGQFR
ncbi:MAG: hypothetical protein ACJ76F_07560 [Bacteroidia bacterium]